MPPPIKPKGNYEHMEPSPSKLVSEKEKEQRSREQQSKEKEQQSKEKEQQSKEKEQQSREKEQRSKDRPERSRPSFKGPPRKKEAAEKSGDKGRKRGGACENSGDKKVVPISKIQDRTKVAPKLPSRDSVSKDSREGKGTRESMPDAFRSQEKPGLCSKQAADDLVNTQPEQVSPPKPKVAHIPDKKQIPEPLPLMIKKTAKSPKTSDKDKKGKKPQEPDNGYDYLDPETKEDENIASKQGAKPKGGEEEEEEEEGTTPNTKHANSIYDPSRMEDKLSKSQADKLTPDAPSKDEGDKREKKKREETQTRDATTLNDTDADKEPKYEKLNFNANRLVNKDPSKFPKPPPSLPSRKKKSQIKPLKMKPEKVAQTPRALSPDRVTRKEEKRDKRDGQSMKEKRDTVMSVKENMSLIPKKQEPPPKASRLDFGLKMLRRTKGDAKEGEPPKEKKKGKLFQLPTFGTPHLPSQIQRKRAGSSGKEFDGRSLKQEVRSLTRILDKYEKQHM